MDDERTANPELAERLQRLRERSASRGAPRIRDLEVVSDPSSAGRARKKREHAAPRARIVAGSLTASAFLAGVTSLIANEQPWTPAMAPTTGPVAPVHRVVYVDQNGNPIDPSALPAAVVAPATAPPPTDAPPAGAPPPAPLAPSNSGGAAGAPPPAPVPDPAATPPPGGDTTAPPPTTAPPAPAPPPTTIATTTTTAPPPPPPPACSGSTCPN